MAQTCYRYCVRCKFGIESAVQRGNQIHSEYSATRSDGIICYYCEYAKPRNIANTLRDAQILLLSAKRLKDTEAIAFYQHQIKLCKSLIDFTPAETEDKTPRLPLE
jgi:hypothetical protein